MEQRLQPHSTALAPVGGGGGGGGEVGLLAPGLFFYHHIAKTAGTSWSVDIATLGGLSHCNTSHLVGPRSLETLADSVTSAVLAGRRQLRTGCNLFNREGGLASSVLRFSLHDVEPKLILLLRDPVTHVRSMYSHCQAPTGVVRLRKEQGGSYRGIGFAEWLSLFDGSSQNISDSSNRRRGRGRSKYCYYNPINYQTHLLVGPAYPPTGIGSGHQLNPAANRLHVSPPAVRALRTLLMERAFFVGLTEYYAQSLCLLGRKLGLGKLSTAGCASEIKVTHSDYGNKAGSTELSNEVLARVRAITQIDQYAYGLALSRLVLEAGNAETSLWR